MIGRAPNCLGAAASFRPFQQRGSLFNYRAGSYAESGSGRRPSLPGCLRRVLGRPPPRLPFQPPARRGRQRPGRGSGGTAVHAVYGWPVDGPLKAIMEIRGKLRPIGVAVRVLWEAQRRWLQHALAQTAVWVALLAGAATAAANLWGVPAINRQLLPIAQAQAAAVLQREVEIGRVNWLAPPGLTGLMPLASVGPVSVGPGPVEKSSVRAGEVLVGVDALRSAMQREVVLTFKARGAEVKVMQGDNFSWFGYPEDTVPSARNFVPGLGGSKPPPGAEGGGGPSNVGGGSGSNGGESTGSQAGPGSSSRSSTDSGGEDSSGTGSDTDSARAAVTASGHAAAAARPGAAGSGAGRQRGPAVASAPASRLQARADAPAPASSSAGRSFLDRFAQLLLEQAQALEDEALGAQQAQQRDAELALLGAGAPTASSLPVVALLDAQEVFMSPGQRPRPSQEGSSRGAALTGGAASASAAPGRQGGDVMAESSGGPALGPPTTQLGRTSRTGMGSGSSSSTGGKLGGPPSRPQAWGQPEARQGPIGAVGSQRGTPATEERQGFRAAAGRSNSVSPSIPQSTADLYPLVPGSSSSSTQAQLRQARTVGSHWERQQSAQSAPGAGGVAQQFEPSSAGAPTSLWRAQRAQQHEAAAAAAAGATVARPRRHLRSMRVHRGIPKSVPFPAPEAAFSLLDFGQQGHVAGEVGQHRSMHAAQAQALLGREGQHASLIGGEAVSPAYAGHGAPHHHQQQQEPTDPKSSQAELMNKHLKALGTPGPLAGVHLYSAEAALARAKGAAGGAAAAPMLQGRPGPASAAWQREVPASAQDAQPEPSSSVGAEVPGLEVEPIPAVPAQVEKAAAEAALPAAGATPTAGEAAAAEPEAAQPAAAAAVQEPAQPAAAGAEAEAAQPAAAEGAEANTAGLPQPEAPLKSLGAQRINSIPPLRFSLPSRPLSPGPLSAAQRQLEQQQEAARAWQALTPAQRKAVIQRIESLPPAALRSLFPAAEEGRRQAFAAFVTDPATLHRKGGSAAIAWRHRRPPAAAIHSARPHPAAGYPASAANAPAPRRAAAAAHEGGAAADGMPSFELDGRTGGPSLGGGLAGLPAGGVRAVPATQGEERPTSEIELSPVSPGKGRRLSVGPRISRPHLTHPGYFTQDAGPKYTPAGPEALADRRARYHSQLKQALGSAAQAVVNKVASTHVAVGAIELESATLLAQIHGEKIPRVVDNLSGGLRLGANYDTLQLELSGAPRQRDPASRKCTMPSPHTPRNLRHVTGLAAQRALAAQQAQQAEQASGSGATPAEVDSPASLTNGGIGSAPDKGAAAPTGDSGTAAPAPATGQQAQQAQQPSSGGSVRVTLQLSGLAKGWQPSKGIVPDMTVSVTGRELHGPIVERLIELPMDINEGRVSGELVVKAHDPATWKFPELHGRLAVRGAEFHFWDSPDDITADMDLLFERDRLYLHNAAGHFGAIPMTLTGDLDLDPDSGRYRLSATVPAVEVNQLRASLGVRPLPLPVAGAVGGTLHITGPLEKPIFSGTVHAVRPTPEMLADCEPTQALEVLLSEPQAAAAYDKLPIETAGAVFTLDTRKEKLELFSLNAQPLGGGALFGSGEMIVAPWAEEFEGAVSFKAEGAELPVEALALRYLPEGAKVPPSLVLGQASLRATFKGSHVSPTLDIEFKLPDANAKGSARLARDAQHMSLSSPTLEASGTLFLDPPSLEQVKAAITQSQALELSKPNFTGCDADITLRGVDVVPLTSDEQALRQLQQSGQPLRLKVNGRAKISGKISPARTIEGPLAADTDANGSAAAENSSAGNSDNANAAAAVPGEGGSGGRAAAAPVSWAFDGSLGLEGVRLNQLHVFKKLAGSLQASEQGISIHAKGDRPDEVLHLDLALPLLPPTPAPSQAPSLAAQPRPFAAHPAGANLRAGGNSGGGVETGGVAARSGGSGLLLRGGHLLVEGNVDARGSQLDLKVQNLRLDELELASLRGDVQEVSCALNFESQSGRGKATLVRPRYSGLMGESLSGGFRWEGDMVRLEKVVVQQDKSKYEVQGEYTFPPNTRLPTNVAELAKQQQGAVPTGRWRVQVTAPQAELQEVIPAARLLQTATSLTPAQYERAKQAFLGAVRSSRIQAQDLKSQLLACLEQMELPASGPVDSPRPGAQPKGSAGSMNSGPPLPGLQDLRGQWSGGIQAYGGGSGPTSLEFDVRGLGWQWGPHYSLDSLVASGSLHSEEGLQLQEFTLKSGDAKLMVWGSLLSERQDATIRLNDFPMATLRPLFRAMPALQHAAPAVSAQPAKPVPSPRPLGMLTNMLGRASNGLGISPGAAASDSPINGTLHLSGKLGGSKDAPTGEVAVRLYDAAIGSTRLAQAQGSARLNDHQQLSFAVDLSPAEGHRTSGHLRAEGRVPLAPLDGPLPDAAQAAAAAPNSGSSSSSSGGSTATSGVAALRRDKAVDVRVEVLDGGMAILTSVTPDLRWQHGNADVKFSVTGTLDAPVLAGHASLSKAALECPAYLRFPLQNVGGEVRLNRGRLEVDNLEARSGRKGHIRLRGTLPMGSNQLGAQAAVGGEDKLRADVQGLELRLRNMYTGQFDASLTVRSSLAQPSIAGSMRVSRGTVVVLPQGAGVPEATASPGAASGAAAASSSAKGTGAAGLGQAAAASARPGQQRWGNGPVARAFEAFTRQEPGLAEQINAMMQHEVEELEHMAEEAEQHHIALDKLTIQLGPDLRATVPLVMNFSVAGSLEVSGPAHPDRVQVRGALRLPSGDVNLVATQLTLDREHANAITFAPPGEAPGGAAGGSQAQGATGAGGVDPLIDMVLTGGDLRLSIQGRASEWQDHLVLQIVGRQAGGPGAAAAAAGGEGAELGTLEAARILEGKLKEALLADNGQLALARLAGTTVSTLMPKIETQGQIGTTRFRLVSAPSIPGLLSLDPSLSDPSALLNSIMMGTQGEIQFGPRLQAVMVRKMGESDVMATQWTLNYNLSSRLRMQFSVTSAPPFPKTLMFSYSSEGSN